MFAAHRFTSLPKGPSNQSGSRLRRAVRSQRTATKAVVGVCERVHLDLSVIDTIDFVPRSLRPRAQFLAGEGYLGASLACALFRFKIGELNTYYRPVNRGFHRAVGAKGCLFAEAIRTSLRTATHLSRSVSRFFHPVRACRKEWDELSHLRADSRERPFDNDPHSRLSGFSRGDVICMFFRTDSLALN